jgi:hypothetical protein
MACTLASGRPGRVALPGATKGGAARRWRQKISQLRHTGL